MLRLFRIFTLVTLLAFFDVSAAQGDSLPDSAYISGVIGHAQVYTLSCESRSASDLAAFWDVSISETDFLSALPQADNPDKGFVGNPNDVWGNIPPYGYGVHASPVAEILQSYGLHSQGLNSLSWDDLRGEISTGHPVIVWIIGKMWDGTPVEYEASDGSTAVVAAFEHTMILTGYDRDTVQVVDAYTGMYQTYPLNTFLKSWAVLGDMAVFASREDTPPSSSGETYTVQPGDYLMALARQFGLSWSEIADLNSIDYPYVIQPGQVLRLPRSEEPLAAPILPEPAPSAHPVDSRILLPVIQSDSGPQDISIHLGTRSASEATPVLFSLSSDTSPSLFLEVDLHFLENLDELILELAGIDF